jgi:hypothetical protein
VTRRACAAAEGDVRPRVLVRDLVLIDVVLHRVVARAGQQYRWVHDLV